MDALMADYIEGDLELPQRRAVELHLGECVRCTSLLRDIDAIRRDAASLPNLEPGRDLWDGIAARIETPVITLPQRAPVRLRESRRLQLGLAAAGLVALTAGVTYTLTRQAFTDGLVVAMETQEPRAPDVAVPEEPSAAAPTQAARPASGTNVAESPAVRPAAAITYDQEIGRLRAILELRRNDLDPATTAIVEASLRTIDRAIADAELALARDSASAFLADQLTRALDKKLSLLRTVALLPART
jgi:hypothetical protein